MSFDFFLIVLIVYYCVYEMPKRTRNEVAKASKKNTWRTRNSSLKTAVQGMPGVAEKQIVKMKYSDQFVLDPGVGSTAGHIFRANSIFDPDYSAGGHQPLGRDEWAVFYDHYTVLNSTCKVTFWSAGTSSVAVNAGIVGIYLDDSPVAISSTTELIEQSKTKIGYLGSSASGSALATAYSYYNAKKHQGLHNVNDNRGLVGAQMDTSPTEQMFFHVFFGGLSTDSDPVAIKCLVEMEYTCYLTEPKTLGQS